ncbi:ERAP1-like C-terminal domain-containing protein [Lysobacter sp. KIS68-7]|uniref:M1 family metallopeptidase n=1 Tax=Lysobacter sp. KIS68-7 TaxID=2904252 RepID=UPI001E5277BD|nr:M1 family metallopeptidase [Lysobacter sp. KIS68-7]UHQ20949.1 ERAP1-like C-terminal domain-containing protein [Lysobacter sp. KIS68-7]
MPVLRRSLLATALFATLGAAHAADSGNDVPKGPLSRNVVPSLVQLELKLDPKQANFTGSTRIQAKVAEATDVIWMHGQGLKISKAEAIVGKKRIALTPTEADVSGVLKMTAAQKIPAGDAVIEIAYEAPFGELQGAYRVKPDGNDYVITQMEPLGARHTFPGFDEPSFKQPWDITLIVPENDAAIANTHEAKTEKLPGGWKKVTFNRTEALPSYLVSFAVGPWDVPQGPDIAPNGSRTTPIPLRGVAAKGQGPRMKYSLANTPAIVTALENYFGVPYPFEKLDNVAAPDFWAGAMENAGMIVYRDSLMFPDENSSVSQRQSFWGTSAHELAHQWFGDLVTMRWWDDLWLNEAFATWMGNKIHGQLRPEAHTDRGILEGGIGAMGADSLSSTRRIHEPIHDFTQIQSAFDGITYQKGGAVLRMFEQYIGEDNFRTGIRNYIKAHARGNATSGDLIAAVAAQSNDPVAVDAAFKSFIDQPGVPFVSIDVQCGAGKPTLVVTQQRYLPLGSTASAAQTWGIPLSVRYSDNGTIREEKGIVTGNTARFELKQAQSCPAWVMPNAHGAGYYRFALAPKYQQSLSGAFAQLDELEQRVYADSVTAAYGAGKMTPSEFIATLPQFASASVRQTVTAGMGSLAWMDDNLLHTEAERAAFRAKAADIYRPRLDQLGLSPKAGEPDDDRILRTTLVRMFAGFFKDPAVRAEMNKQGRTVLGLGGDGALHADAVSKDLRAIALGVAVQEGGKEAFDAAEKHFRASQDATIRSQLLGAMGDTQDPALADRARALVFEKDLLRRNEIFPVVGGQSDEEKMRPALRQWVDAHFTELEARLAPAGAALVGLYSAGMCSNEQATDVQARFEDRMKNIEGGPLELKQTVEGIRLCSAQKEARKDLVPTFASKQGVAK